LVSIEPELSLTKRNQKYERLQDADTGYEYSYHAINQFGKVVRGKLRAKK